MQAHDQDWQARVDHLWTRLDAMAPDTFVADMAALAAERAPGDPAALFELACAQDSTGHSDLAAPLYQAALAGGLAGLRRRRAVIQWSSSLRNLGQSAQAERQLRAELAHGSDELDGAVRAFLALALADLGREREALALSLGALSHTLPRYNRSLARYAQDLLRPLGSTDDTGATG